MSSRSTGRALARFMPIRSSRPATASSISPSRIFERAAAELVIRRGAGRVVQHVDRPMPRSELPQSRAWQHRGVNLHALAAGVENLSVERVQCIRQSRQVRRIGLGEDIDVDRRAHVSVSLNREPTDDDVVDRACGERIEDALRVEGRITIHRSPPLPPAADVPPTGSPIWPVRVVPPASARAMPPDAPHPICRRVGVLGARAHSPSPAGARAPSPRSAPLDPARFD